jgi:cobaltochelatase CobS
MNSSTYRYSADGRAALKSAIAAAPGWRQWRESHGVSGTGALSIAGLEAAAADLGIDPAAFALGAAPAVTPPQAATAPAAVVPSIIDDTDDADTDDADTDDADTAGPDTVTDAQGDALAVDPLADAVAAVLSGDLAGLPARVSALAARALDAEAQAATLAARPLTLPVSPAAPGVSPVALPLTYRTDTAGRAFGLRGAGARIPVQVAAHPLAPAVDTAYEWPDALLDVLALAADGRGVRAWLAGEAGVGKTTFARQLAARLGRPFYRINFDRSVEAPDLLGMMVPDTAAGGARWADGQLAIALRQPGAVILLDEPTTATPGAMAILHAILEPGGALSIRDTGEVLPVSPDTLFLAADNTLGHGDESGRYPGTQPANGALLDRFELVTRLEYLPAEREAKMVAARSGAPLPLCAALVELAGYSRAAASRGEMLAGLGPRRLIALARLIHAGRKPATAWGATVALAASPEDREALAQLWQAHGNAATLAALARGEVPAAPAETDAGAAAQRDFEPVTV